jgi:hypothetical protein
MVATSSFERYFNFWGESALKPVAFVDINFNMNHQHKGKDKNFLFTTENN